MRKITPLQYAIFLYEITSEKQDIKNNIKGFVEILAKNNDFSKINEIIRRFETYDKKMKGIYDVEITSASPLESAAKKHIIESLKNYGKIEIKEAVNPGLIAGITLTIEDVMVDGSLKNKLRELEKVLK